MAAPQQKPDAVPAIRITWFEQSHFSFTTPGARVIHVDPFLSRVVKPENHIHAEPLVSPGEAYADVVLLTHDHRDHTDPHTLGPMARRNPACEFYGSEESCARCEEAGIGRERLHILRVGDVIADPDCSIEVVYAENTSDSDATTHLGFILSFPRGVVYITGDSHAEVSKYRARLSRLEGLDPDLMIVPINEKYHNPGPAGAKALVEIAGPKRIVPCHFGCFKNNTIDPALFIDELPEPYQARVTVLDRGGEIDL